jgi:hypothetical protein
MTRKPNPAYSIEGWYKPMTLKGGGRIHFFSGSFIAICGKRAAVVSSGVQQPTRETACAICARATGLNYERQN